MSYQDQLSPWVVYRHLPNLQRLEVARFRRRNDAEEYLKIIRRMAPQAQFEIVYEVEQDEPTGDRPSPISNSPDFMPLSNEHKLGREHFDNDDKICQSIEFITVLSFW